MHDRCETILARTPDGKLEDGPIGPVEISGRHVRQVARIA
jgi:hypothetical protein